MTKKIFKFLWRFILILLIVSLACSLVYKIYLNNLFKRVDLSAKEEIGNLNFSTEFESLRRHSENDCSYDYKVRSIRCYTKYVRFFGSKDDQLTTYKKLDEYLLNSEWKSSSVEKTEAGLVRNVDAKLSLYNIYSKPGPNGNLYLYLTVYGEESYSEIENLPSSPELKIKSVYSLSISTDF